MLEISSSSPPLPSPLSPRSNSTTPTRSPPTAALLSNFTSPPPVAPPPPPLKPARFPPPLKASRFPPPPKGGSPPSLKRRTSPPTAMSPPSIPKSPPFIQRSPPEETIMTTAVVVGTAAAAVALLVILSLSCVCCCRKKKMKPPPVVYDNLPPNKDDPYAEPHNWQQTTPPLEDHVIKLPPQSPTPPLYDSRSPQHPVYSSSGSMSKSSTHGTLLLPTPSFITRCMFSYEELMFATNGFSESNLLGQGGFGYVHKGILPNCQEVAIKQLKAGSRQGEREFQAEVDIISRVHHKHLVSLVGYCISGDQRLLVYEFVPNKTLEYHLHGEGLPTMDWPTRLKIALGASKGLAYLHEDCQPRIIHRDIKASNILLDFDFEAMVGDFGLAKIASDNSSHVSTRVMGTFGYMAPEYASSGKLTDRSDVFSFGVMLLELITGKRPVDRAQNDMDDSLVDWARPLLMRAMDFGNYDILVDHRLGKNYNPNEMARMIACAASCVRHSARHRPKMSQVVRALEGHIPLDDLSEDTKQNYTSYSSAGESDYDSSHYNKNMKKVPKTGLSNREYSSSEYSASTSSQYGRLYSATSSEGRTNTREMEKIKEDSHDV